MCEHIAGWRLEGEFSGIYVSLNVEDRGFWLAACRDRYRRDFMHRDTRVQELAKINAARISRMSDEEVLKKYAHGNFFSYCPKCGSKL